MTRGAPILLPSAGPENWKRLLAKPDLHWKPGRSASAMAHAWQQADGWPSSVATLLTAAFGPCEPLFVAPEWQTRLPGGDRPSQSDALLLIRLTAGTAVVTVEGKVIEPFGPTVGEKRREASAGVRLRLAWLLERLGVADCPDSIHYQLLHRTASALIEADRFGSVAAMMIVHSFAPDQKWFDAFARFARLLGGNPGSGVPVPVTVPGRVPLLLGWASDPVPDCRCQPACHGANGNTAA